MRKIDIVRAWKDPEYRNSLTEAERNSVEPNPAGNMEVGDELLKAVSGGATTDYCTTGCNDSNTSWNLTNCNAN